MKIILKKLIDPRCLIKLPSIIKFHLIRFYHEKILFKTATKKTIFTSIWRSNYWGNAESLSGVGSTLVQTEDLRKKIPVMFYEFGIKSVFDAPCGDMNWMRHLLNHVDIMYLGGDIVGELIKKNNGEYSNQKVKFLQFDTHCARLREGLVDQ